MAYVEERGRVAGPCILPTSILTAYRPQIVAVGRFQYPHNLAETWPICGLPPFRRPILERVSIICIHSTAPLSA